MFTLALGEGHAQPAGAGYSGLCIQRPFDP